MNGDNARTSTYISCIVIWINKGNNDGMWAKFGLTYVNSDEHSNWHMSIRMNMCMSFELTYVNSNEIYLHSNWHMSIRMQISFIRIDICQFEWISHMPSHPHVSSYTYAFVACLCINLCSSMPRRDSNWRTSCACSRATPLRKKPLNSSFWPCGPVFRSRLLQRVQYSWINCHVVQWYMIIHISICPPLYIV